MLSESNVTAKTAAPPVSTRTGKYLIFHLGREHFGIRVLKVREIMGLQDITAVPHTPVFVKGVFNLRGKVIPVIALRKRLGLDSLDADKKTRIVVVDVHGQILGFVVDSVSEVLRIKSETVEPSPKLGPVERDYISGVGKLDNRLLLLIDLEKLMDDERLTGHATVH